MMLLMKSYSKADAKNAPERARRSSKSKQSLMLPDSKDASGKTMLNSNATAEEDFTQR
jgi:hypothetical protein